MAAITDAGPWTQAFFQNLLNYRSQTFAGSYKFSAYLSFICASLIVGAASPAVVGKYDSMPGITAQAGIFFVFGAAMAWQAFTLPAASRASGDEHED
jgi:hypothetical protein